jgi:hypothetical protein
MSADTFRDLRRELVYDFWFLWSLIVLLQVGTCTSRLGIREDLRNHTHVADSVVIKGKVLK